ncbi:hypothetical protein MLD38_032681 [Melastoma candidum]|uniref:Uncharacterized protein n=1 Tax=Melastoma candidum TaxID=119954 RepID=A0ACB9M662_9MYRT|nr:hypothetical protein MLD38_032681 [Melastoma candidum]
MEREGEVGVGLGGTLWEHLPLLVRTKSPESIEFILQALWKTRKTGLDPADRSIISEMLLLQDDTLLDPLLVCLRMLIRNVVPENLDEVGIQGLFPSEILPELRRLLTLLLLRLQRGWREDLLKDQAPVSRFKAMTWSMSASDGESADPEALVKLELQSDAKLQSGDSELLFRVPKDTSANILVSIRSLREQLSGVGETSNSAVS